MWRSWGKAGSEDAASHLYDLHSSLCLLQGFLKKLEGKKNHCLGQACKFYRHHVLSCSHTPPLGAPWLPCAGGAGTDRHSLQTQHLGEQLVRKLWVRMCLKQVCAVRCRGAMCQCFTFLVRGFSVSASGFSSSPYDTSSAQQCMEIDLQASMRLFL